jgi:hypothetical protein
MQCFTLNRIDVLWRDANIAIGEHMNKVSLIQYDDAAAALALLSPGRLGAQAPSSTQASSPQPSATAANAHR